MIAAVYSDGGLIGRNPSLVGGTFAWCHVDERGERVKCGSGILRPEHIGGAAVSNNHTELMAALSGLSELPDGWSGKLCSDSSVTLARLCYAGRLKNVPVGWHGLIGHTLRRLGKITPVLLSGHPTREQLAAGIGKRGTPVSIHNVWCDKECSRRAREAALW